MDETTQTCPWCSSPIPPGATACPKCGAVVEGAHPTDIPGLTTIDPKAPKAELPGSVPNPVDWFTAGRDPVFSNSAFKAPSPEVEREIRKMELEAEILNAGTSLMNPTGDVTIDAGAPSGEAIEALEDGLLDKTGPAGETDLADLATPWEDPNRGGSPGA